MIDNKYSQEMREWKKKGIQGFEMNYCITDSDPIYRLEDIIFFGTPDLANKDIPIIQ